MSGQVIAVSRAKENIFTKTNRDSIRLVQGLGVAGDAHAGKRVQHLYLAKKDPTAPNLRQVHLMHIELFDEVRTLGFDVNPGDLGENITTRGIDLLGLPRGSLLRIGSACIEITGLRHPCHQIDKFQKGLLKAVTGKDAAGAPVFKAGIMAIVLTGGMVQTGDGISVALPGKPHQPLELV